MTDIVGLTGNQVLFYDWLKENATHLIGLWDWEERSVSQERVADYLATASHGESIMCRFAVSLWLGRNDGFDFFEAAGVLGQQQRAAITDWFNAPLWP